MKIFQAEGIFTGYPYHRQDKKETLTRSWYLC